ncbi:MAG: substrate-binding domain-containing protein [Prevotella sp.]|nr:substrate-binding domain-containing protein [Prevotella sp.]
MVLGLCLVMMACSEKKREYIIGVSQCSEDIWRSWQNSEMQMEANFHEGVELRFTAAKDDSQRQIQQIDSLVDSGIDLLIVAPNQRASVTPAINRAFDKGIPVIVFERKTDSQKYTAFVSADNYEMGHQMGGYIVIRMSGKGQVLELLGLKGSSPADDRHRGFRDAINNSFIEVPITLQGDWTEEKAYEEVKNYKGSLDDIDLVFAHNDRSAIGARRAFIDRGVNPLPMFCGIDGLPGENGGIRQVRDSLLEASYIYPTRGDHLLKLALDILDGKEYQRETVLTSAIVTHDNANVLLLESDEVLRQAQNLDKLQAKAKGYLEQLAAQRTITLMALILLALVILVLVLFYLYHRGKVSAQRERMVSNLWNIDASEVVEHYNDEETPQESSDEKQTENTSEKEETDDATEIKKEPLFIVRFKDVVEARLSNSDITVDDLAEAMNLSRVQLYRKVKAISGSSPNELLRTARLNRAYQLLLTTDKNISEVAYEVGFTAPSYFTKCFKDEFGVSPSDLNQG